MNYLISLICLAVFAASCSKIGPAGFWTDFHKGLILKAENDQGPWGGQREITWKSETANTFTNKDLIEFADKNDWQLSDSISSELLTRTSLTRLKIDDYSLEILDKVILPNLKSKDERVFVFKTTWLAIEPGNNRETFENGFAVLNSDGTELKVFHRWGE
jgi:hypothetical protein